MLRSETASGVGGSGVVDPRWWGEFEVQPGHTRRWRVGPMTLWIHHSALEWRLAIESGDEHPTEAGGLTDAEPQPGASFQRFGMRPGSSTVLVQPALADRALVVKTEHPFHIPAGEEATLFVSSPLWVVVSAAGLDVPLYEFPIVRPSDTWFGPNSLTGELCYASTTSARLQLDNLPRRPHRAISAVRIRNRAKSKLAIDKLLLPLTHLSLFASEKGQLWTEALTFKREEESDQAIVELDRSPTHTREPTELVAPPRQRASKGFLLEAFGSLFSRIVERDE